MTPDMAALVSVVALIMVGFIVLNLKIRKDRGGE